MPGKIREREITRKNEKLDKHDELDERPEMNCVV
jgi:hypothetical protein